MILISNQEKGYFINTPARSYRYQVLLDFAMEREPEKADLFIIALGDKATGKALELAGDMRSEGFAVLMDLNQRSLRAQMKYANKLGARYTVVLGDNEVDTDRVQLKAMDTGEETEVALSTFVNGFYSVSMQAQLADLEINGEAFDFTSLFQTGETE